MVQEIIKIAESYNYIISDFLKVLILNGKFKPNRFILVDYPNNETLNFFLQKPNLLKNCFKRRKEIDSNIRVYLASLNKSKNISKLDLFTNKWKKKIWEINAWISDDNIMYCSQIYRTTQKKILSSLKPEELDNISFSYTSLQWKYNRLYEKLDSFWKSVACNVKPFLPTFSTNILEQQQKLFDEYANNLITVENEIRTNIKEIENEEQVLKIKPENLYKEYEVKRQKDEGVLLSYIDKEKLKTKNESNYIYFNINDFDERLEYYEKKDFNSDNFIDFFKPNRIKINLAKIHLFRNTFNFKLTSIPRFDSNFILLNDLSKSQTIEEYTEIELKLLENYNLVYDFAISNNDNIAVEDLTNGRIKRNKLSDINRNLFTYNYTKLPIYSKYDTLRNALITQYNIELLNGFIYQNDFNIVIDFLLKNKHSFSDFDFWQRIFKEQLT